MDKPSQGWLESDDDYAARIAREADERSVELAKGQKPSAGWLESDEDYARRLRREANESEFELSSGEKPSQGFFESDEDYEKRIGLDARRSVVASQDESKASQGWFEDDGDYRRRIYKEADEAAIERETGSRPSQGLFESDEDYRARIWQEARELRVARDPEDVGYEPEPAYEYSYTSSDSSSSTGSSSTSSGWSGWLVLAVIVFGVIFVSRDGQRISPATSQSLRSAYVDAAGLNVRAGPGRDHAIVTTLLRGDAVQIIGNDSRSTDWVRVRVDGREGWVNGDYLSDRIDSAPRSVPRVEGMRTARPRVTLQYQLTSDRQIVADVQEALGQHAEWRVGEPERVLPAGENRPEVYGGLRYYFESDLPLARAVCMEVVSELARQGMTVTMPLWPMVTGQREGRFNASPGLIEVWISPLPSATGGPAPMGQCGR
ncbi:MAG TPA: SH3 domain-containing protein [Longimicrobium sp.]|nr:SH3 domain-containing protein [Longimicrobium sp.]